MDGWLSNTHPPTHPLTHLPARPPPRLPGSATIDEDHLLFYAASLNEVLESPELVAMLEELGLTKEGVIKLFQEVWVWAWAWVRVRVRAWAWL